MAFYEVIFEPGDHSIVSADSDQEVLGFATEQHQRAKSGLPGGPAGHRADRIVRILKYDQHPGEDNVHMTAKAAAARFKEVADLSTTDDGVNLAEVARVLVPPVVLDTPVHESNYAVKEVGELDPSDWGGEALT